MRGANNVVVPRAALYSTAGTVATGGVSLLPLGSELQTINQRCSITDTAGHTPTCTQLFLRLYLLSVSKRSKRVSARCAVLCVPESSCGGYLRVTTTHIAGVYCTVYSVCTVQCTTVLYLVAGRGGAGGRRRITWLQSSARSSSRHTPPANIARVPSPISEPTPGPYPGTTVTPGPASSPPQCASGQ